MTPTSKHHPHNRYPDDTYPRSAEENDARLQPDPELALSAGHASRSQIWLVAIGSAVIAGLVLYGITQPHNERSERQLAGQAPAAATTGSAPSAEQPAQQPQDQKNQKPDQPAQEPAKPGPSESTRPQ